jgi:hypothetical protein
MGRSYEGPWQGKFEKDGMETARLLDAGDCAPGDDLYRRLSAVAQQRLRRRHALR